MTKEVKFTKEQCKVLKQVFEDANRSFDKNMAEKPYLYHEYERNAFVSGYIEVGFEQIIESGRAFLEK